MSFITITNLRKSYQMGRETVHALAGVSLDIEANSFWAVMGPSGSGKSTLMYLLGGLDRPSGGQIQVGQQAIESLDENALAVYRRRTIGFIFQSFNLIASLSALDNVAFPLRLRKVRSEEVRRRVEDCLRMVQLSDYAGRMPKELSGGQRQRVAFARAVVFEPPVLLMDEPLGALDLKLREAMQLEIKRYHGQLGCTIVFVTHDQGEALALSDRIAVMGDGRITQVDSPDRIYDAPNSRYVAEFIGRTNLLDFERAVTLMLVPSLVTNVWQGAVGGML